MASRPRHLVRKGRPGGKDLWYWTPSASLRKLGFRDIRLDDDEARAMLEAEEWNAKADETRVAATIEGGGVVVGTVNHLIATYLAHDDYLLLAAATRRGYRQSLEVIRANLGPTRLKAVTPPAVQMLKRGLAATPFQANAVIRALRLLWSFGIREGMAPAPNPAARFRQLKTRAREQVWSHEQEEAFLAVAQAEIRLAYLLAVYTAQRETDLLRLPWSAYDGEVVRLTQSKTKRRLVVPVTLRLRAELDQAARRGPLILTTATGRAWGEDHFRHRFTAAMKAAQIADRQFRDLRRTAVVRLAEAGCTVPEVAAITGHDIDECQRIIDVYLPRTRQLAEAAILKLEAVGNGGRKRNA